MSKEWLVEIAHKSWVPMTGKTRTFTYEEVLADDEYFARHAAFEQFEKRVKYEPIMRRKFEQCGRPITDYCAPAAIEI